jgi:hypothetical protein
MQVEFAGAASEAAAVAPRDARFGGGAWAGRCVASTATVHHVRAVVRSGRDGESGESRSESCFESRFKSRFSQVPAAIRTAPRGGMTVIPVGRPVAKTGMQFARPHTGTGNGPKEGVMAHDAGMGGHRTARHCGAATLAGS